MKQAALVVAGLLILSGCNAGTAGGSGSLQRPGENPSQTLAQARQGFSTHLIAQVHDSGPVDQPPAGVFELVHYTSAVGSLAAYLTPPPGPGRHPAIIWITGGDDNSIGDVWSPSPADNDQSAAQYRDAGIMMMFPSLRGGNDNPGYEEGFMGEADDIVAAAEFLAEQPGVDPNRIYLGGHSTGGTMVLIESEYTDRFRAVFHSAPSTRHHVTTLKRSLSRGTPRIHGSCTCEPRSTSSGQSPSPPSSSKGQGPPPTSRPCT